MSSTQPSDRTIAVFIDFENLALGFKDRQGRFEIKYVLKRLLETGKIVAKRSYADWSRFSSYTFSLHESAIELIEIPKRSQTGKNSADIRLCVDAMDLAYSKDHINTFVIVSGDSDFSPLVSKLKELGKHVIGLGMTDSTSALLRDNCDEFIYYEDLVPVVDSQTTIPLSKTVTEPRRNAFNMLFDALAALRRDDREVLGAALLKNTMCRMHPGFTESHFGYRSFSAFLQDAAKEGLLELTLHQKSGTWVVARFGEELKTAPILPSSEASPPTIVRSAPLAPPISANVSEPITTASAKVPNHSGKGHRHSAPIAEQVTPEAASAPEPDLPIVNVIAEVEIDVASEKPAARPLARGPGRAPARALNKPAPSRPTPAARPTVKAAAKPASTPVAGAKTSTRRRRKPTKKSGE
jgi:uncharacterized protein (TIGR00288 family)